MTVWRPIWISWSEDTGESFQVFFRTTCGNHNNESHGQLVHMSSGKRKVSFPLTNDCKHDSKDLAGCKQQWNPLADFAATTSAKEKADDGKTAGDHPESAKDYFRSIYFEALDLVIYFILDRLSKPGYKLYSRLELLLVNVVNRNDFYKHLKSTCDFFNETIWRTICCYHSFKL